MVIVLRTACKHGRDLIDFHKGVAEEKLSAIIGKLDTDISMLGCVFVVVLSAWWELKDRVSFLNLNSSKDCVQESLDIGWIHIVRFLSCAWTKVPAEANRYTSFVFWTQIQLDNVDFC